MEKLKAQALIVDGDGTLWEGRVAAGIGKAYLMKELFRGHFSTFNAGLKGAKEVKQTVITAGANGEAEGLKKFYDVLVSLGIGKDEEMARYALKYIKKHRLKAVQDFLRQTRDGIPTILSTIGGNTAASEAAKYFSIDYFIANTDKFSKLEGRLLGVNLLIRNGDEKLAETLGLLDRMNVKIEDCVAIGDSSGDIPILKSVKLRYASPLATDEVKALPGIVQLRA